MTLRRGASPVEGTEPTRCCWSGDWYQGDISIGQPDRPSWAFTHTLPPRQPDQPGPWA
jgi:hypothetical protein